MYISSWTNHGYGVVFRSHLWAWQCTFPIECPLVEIQVSFFLWPNFLYVPSILQKISYLILIHVRLTLCLTSVIPPRLVWISRLYYVIMYVPSFTYFTFLSVVNTRKMYYFLCSGRLKSPDVREITYTCISLHINYIWKLKSYVGEVQLFSKEIIIKCFCNAVLTYCISCLWPYLCLTWLFMLLGLVWDVWDACFLV